MGSTECFLFDVGKVILDINQQSSTFTWLKKSDCQDHLDRASNDFFRDVQLLLGSSFLPTFPLLGRNASGRVTVREASVMLNTAGRNVIQLCQQFREDPQVMLLQYADRYKKAIMTIRHHVVLQQGHKIEPMDRAHAPGDVHEFIGQRLPEELFDYISKGMIGAQIPNWLATSEVSLSLPAGAQDSEAYRKLVVDQLNPIRETTLKLISESMNRYYQSRTIKISPWFERDTTNLTITIRDVPAVASQLDFWKIKSEDLPKNKDGSSVGGSAVLF
jgi:Temperature dependent protein affecting M2 dsRNA replication